MLYGIIGAVALIAIIALIVVLASRAYPKKVRFPLNQFIILIIIKTVFLLISPRFSILFHVDRILIIFRDSRIIGRNLKSTNVLISVIILKESFSDRPFNSQ